MKEWPEATVLIVTFDRPDEIRRTIRSLVDKVRYPGPLRWHIADDGSPPGYVHGVKRDFPELNFTATVTNRQGWGANVNKALVTIPTDYVYLNEDDYVALKKVDLRAGVAVLESMETIGAVRYDGVSGHALDLNLREVRTRMGMVDVLMISRNSPHLNIYSNRPHLRHRRFHDHFGLYAEGLALGATESNYAHRVRDKVGLAVVTLGDGVERAFDHIGKSRQLTAQDVTAKTKRK